MKKATATYHAPEGDAKSVNIGGVVFNDGESVDINSDEHPHLMNKLSGNQHFEFNAGKDDQKEGEDKPRRGRPPNTRDFKAGIEEARDHDFEADQRRNLANHEAMAGTRKPAPGARKSQDKPASAE